jgi:hypothetical protein
MVYIFAFTAFYSSDGTSPVVGCKHLMNTNQIAGEYGCHRTTVSSILKKSGVIVTNGRSHLLDVGEVGFMKVGCRLRRLFGSLGLGKMS